MGSNSESSAGSGHQGDRSSSDGGPEERPVSLQASTLQYIARHIHDFPPSHVACLPAHLRCELLVALPAIDICRLEEGPVCADINTNEQVWKRVGFRNMCLSRSNCEVRIMKLTKTPSHSEWDEDRWGLHYPTDEEVKKENFHKDRLFSVIVDLLTGNEVNKKEVMRGLFLSPGSHTCERQKRLPALYENYASAFSDIEVLQILMNDCHFYPSECHLDCQTLLYSSLWQQRPEAFALLGRFFSRLKHISISAPYSPYANLDEETEEMQNRALSQACRFILEVVFLQRSSSLALSHFSIGGGVDFVAEAFTHLLDFASPHSGGTVAKFARGPLVSGYDGIEYISIDIEAVESITELSDLHANVRLVFEHQRYLNTLHLCGWGCGEGIVCAEYDELVQCISRLFRSPYFYQLLIDMDDSSRKHVVDLEAILHEFISSPVRGQVLQLDGFYSIERREFGAYLTAGVSSNTAGGKHLHVEEQDGTYWLNDTLTQCLAVNSLEALSLVKVRGLSDDSLAAIASSNLKAIYFMMTDLGENIFECIDPVAKLFAMPGLKSLKMKEVLDTETESSDSNSSDDSISAQFVRAVTVGLQRRPSGAQLNNLDLSENSLSRVKASLLMDMFDAVFSLPQLSEMSLNLESNSFSLDYLLLIRKSWDRKAKRHRLHILFIKNQNRILTSDEAELAIHSVTPIANKIM